jgi:hypothetical protein
MCHDWKFTSRNYLVNTVFDEGFYEKDLWMAGTGNIIID